MTGNGWNSQRWHVMQYTISKYSKQNLHASLKQNQPCTALHIWQHTTWGVQCMLGCSQELNFTFLFFKNLSACLDQISMWKSAE